MRRAVVAPAVALVAGAIALVPDRALACPSCAAGREAGTGELVLLGGMIAAPFVVAAIVATIVRRLG